MWSILLIVATAVAEPVEVYSRLFEWPDGETMAGVDDWSRGYGQDEWWGAGGYMMSTSDIGGGDFGDGGPADNFLVWNGLEIADGLITASMTTWDDDTMGSVFRHRDGANFYGAMLVGSSVGSGGGFGSNPFGLSAPRAALVRVEDGHVTVLDEEWFSPTHGSDIWVVLGADGDQIFAKFYSNYDDLDADDPAIELGYVDGRPLGPGLAGVYTYNSGGTSTGWGHDDDYSLTIFEAVVIMQEEADADADADTDTGADTGGEGDGMSDRNRASGVDEVGSSGKLTACRCAIGPDGQGLPGLAGLLGLMGLLVRTRRR